MPPYEVSSAPNWRHWARTAGATTVLCAVIALVTQALNDQSYWLNLWISLGYGQSIVLSLLLLGHWRPRWPDWLANTVGLFCGVALGMLNLVVTTELVGGGRQVLSDSSVLWSNIGIGLFFGSIGLFFFYSLYRLQVMRAEVSEQQRLRAEREQALTLSQLKVLQSQMEPHFLFNTLANVQALIDTDPAKAQRMVEALTTMLRANLQRVRADTTTLQEELDIVESYLEIQAIRMGERLQYRLSVPEDLLALELPPLVLQPLVENAIRHGLEPKPQGGHLTVLAERGQDQAGRPLCRLHVIDSGLGLAATSDTQGSGLGLSNLRTRLKALYGDRAELIMRERCDSAVAEEGLHLTVVLPLSEENSARGNQ